MSGRDDHRARHKGGVPMLRRCLIAVAMVTLLASPSFAQRAEVSGMFGYTFSEGVDFNQAVPTQAGTYTRISPKSGVSYGFSFGVYATPQAEIEFLFSHQASTLNVTGPNAPDLNGDMGVNNYHGNFVYNFGDESAMARPFAFIGLGATGYGDAVFASQSG